MSWTFFGHLIGIEIALSHRNVEFFGKKLKQIHESTAPERTTWLHEDVLGSDAFHRSSAYAVLQTVPRPDVYSAVYGIVYYN